MAKAQESLFKSSSSIENIKKSLNSFGVGLRKANSSSSAIIKGLYEGNREKKKEIGKRRALFERRREAVRRREREDVIEAGKVGSIFKSATKTISNSTQGFLGRVMGFVGTIMVGWIVNNLPRIIKGAEQLIERMGSLFNILSGWVDNTMNFFTGYTADLGGVLSRLMGFDFETERKNVDKGTDKIGEGTNKMNQDMEKAIQELRSFDLVGALEKLLGKLPFSRPSADGGDGTSGGGGTTGGGWKPILDIIGSAEGGYTSIAPGDKNDNLTKMTIREAANATGERGGRGAIGRYQLTNPIQQAINAGLDPDKDIFNPDNQDRIALSLIKGRGITADMIINNPTEAARRLAMEFAGIPVLEATQGYKQQVQRGQSFYRGYNNNKATITAEQLERAFKQFKTNFTAPKIDKSKRYNKREDVSSVLGAPSVITSLKGAQRKNGTHGGIDIGCDPGLYISLRGVDAEVVGTRSGGGYGNVIDIWIPSLKIQLRFAHNTRFLISQPGAKIPAGTSFAVTGYSGTVDPPGPAGSHIHLEADTRKGNSEYGGNTSPDPYVALIRLTQVDIKGTGSRNIPDFTGSGGPTLESASRREEVAEQIKTKKRGQIITVPIPSSGRSAPPSPPPASQPLKQPGSISGKETSLNRFVSLSLLRELEYT